MTRRNFLWTASAMLSTPSRLSVPVYRILDARAKGPPAQFRLFESSIWPEAVRDFRHGGIDLQVTDGPGEIRYSPGDRPILVGLRRGIVNLILTDHIPMFWDNGREWAGVTTIRDGYHVCMIALRHAHGNQAAFLSVNTCVHELLHALMQDIYLKSPTWYQAGEREFRIDSYATRLWLFHEGAAIRQSAAVYLKRLTSSPRARHPGSESPAALPSASLLVP